MLRKQWYMLLSLEDLTTHHAMWHNCITCVLHMLYLWDVGHTTVLQVCCIYCTCGMLVTQLYYMGAAYVVLVGCWWHNCITCVLHMLYLWDVGDTTVLQVCCICCTCGMLVTQLYYRCAAYVVLVGCWWHNCITSVLHMLYLWDIVALLHT